MNMQKCATWRARKETWRKFRTDQVRRRIYCHGGDNAPLRIGIFHPSARFGHRRAVTNLRSGVARETRGNCPAHLPVPRGFGFFCRLVLVEFRARIIPYFPATLSPLFVVGLPRHDLKGDVSDRRDGGSSVFGVDALGGEIFVRDARRRTIPNGYVPPVPGTHMSSSPGYV